MTRNLLPALLSFNAGYVDTIGFLALGGLFTAHVTGNFVTLGAAAAFGSSGIISKLLALPVFCIAVVLARALSMRFFTPDRRAFHVLLVVMLALLAVAAAEAMVLGPFPHGDNPGAILTGMTMILAMAIQNVVQRTHFSKFPPATLMTGTTTQIMIDTADLISGQAGNRKPEVVARMRMMGKSLLSFAIGCLLAALAYVEIGLIAFLLPPLVALVAVLRFDREVPVA